MITPDLESRGRRVPGTRADGHVDSSLRYLTSSSFEFAEKALIVTIGFVKVSD
jgi:hypothetical protein